MVTNLRLRTFIGVTTSLLMLALAACSDSDSSSGSSGGVNLFGDRSASESSDDSRDTSSDDSRDNNDISIESSFSGSDSDILDVVYENAAAANAEDIDRYMATIHPDSSLYAQTETLMMQVNSQYDLHYEASNVSVTSRSDSEARVAFTLTTIKISGPAFQDNRITGEFIMRRYNGGWRIYSQEIDNIDYLP